MPSTLCLAGEMSHIAFFTPLRPVKSALADHAEGILPHLRETLDITVVTNGTYMPSDPQFSARDVQGIRCIDYAEFQKRVAEFDLVVYQMGDEPDIHGYMLDALPRYPGLVLLNDLVMHHAIIGRTLGKARPDLYLKEMAYSYGQAGIRLARRVIAGEANDLTWRLPLVERILDQSLAVAGFNQYMCNQIGRLRPDLPCRLIPYPFYLPRNFPKDYDGTELRESLRLQERPVVASFGFFIPDKRLSLTLRAFRRLLEKHPTAFYLLVGGSSPYYDLEGELRAEGLEGHVRLTGWQDPISFVKHMHVPDVAVHLRWPHIGGTPYTPIRLVGLGVPTIVSDIEPLAEIPRSAVLRIPPNAIDEEERLVACMDEVLSNPERAASMAAEGRSYIMERHDMAKIVADYSSYIEWAIAHRGELEAAAQSRRNRADAVESSAHYRMLLGVFGEALSGLGISRQDDRWIRPMARAVAGLLPVEES